MTKIVKLEIKNYKAIKDLTLTFNKDQSLICLIGRGDTGKTSILEAISAALSPKWNLNFCDTDFYSCDHTKNIEILVSLIDFPEKLLSESKFGLYSRVLNTQTNQILDNILIEETNSNLLPVNWLLVLCEFRRYFFDGMIDFGKNEF